jgi:hypothetical protein
MKICGFQAYEREIGCRTGMLYMEVKRAVEPLGICILDEVSRNQEYFAGGTEDSRSRSARGRRPLASLSERQGCRAGS